MCMISKHGNPLPPGGGTAAAPTNANDNVPSGPGAEAENSSPPTNQLTTNDE